MTYPKVETVREMMARKLITLSPDQDMRKAAGILLKKKISGAPVVDSEGRLLGLLSEFDCLRAVAASSYEMDERDVVTRVGDLMTTSPITVGPEMDLFTLAHEFVNHRVRRFPVVENGRLIGQVSRRDALRAALAFRREQNAAEQQQDYPDYPSKRVPIHSYPQH